ncbi:MAG: hypothetical protein ABSD27_01410 [Bryobacteraceae bacterium]|jgi:hypothetical protein
MNGPSMQVSAPEGLAHFPQMPTPQLVMYSMAPMIRSSPGSLWPAEDGPHQAGAVSTRMDQIAPELL